MGSFFIARHYQTPKRLQFLDTDVDSNYNTLCAEVAQLVEQRTENPCVPSSNLGFGTITKSGSSSAVECLLAKEEVASSNLVFRSSAVKPTMTLQLAWQ